MEAVLSGVIAIVGTLLGSVVTYIFQRRTTERAEQLVRHERLRQERLAAYGELAGAVMDLRRAANDRWHRYREDQTGTEYLAARDEYFQLYTVARNAHLRMRLLTDDTELINSGNYAVESAGAIRDADTEGDRKVLSTRARDALNVFVTTAASRLR